MQKLSDRIIGQDADIQTIGEKPVHLAPHSRVEQITQSDVNDGVPTGVWVLGAPVWWCQGYTGAGITVGIIDTGIDNTHPDFRTKKIIRRDYINDGAAPTQFNPHGTHVAGTIAANGKIRGVAPDATLIDYRVFDTQGGGATNAIITRAIEQSIEDGCDIINLSLGGPYDYPPMRKSIQKAVSRGIMVIVAAGNEGDSNPDTVQIGYPAYYPEVVSVGAVNYSTKTGTIEQKWWSNRNDQVDVCADGFEVLSTVPGNKYASFSGTSMASPHVAGFCALLLQKLQKALWPDVQGAELENKLWSMLKDNTVDIFKKGIDVSSGSGFVTAYPAIPRRDPTTGVLTVVEQTFGRPK